MTRRAALTLIGAGGGLLGLGYALTAILGDPVDEPRAGLADVGDSGMMGGTPSTDMSAYMDMFNRHNELRRSVEDIPGGVRTTTESDSPDLTAQLQGHVAAMYTHLDRGNEVTCMSASLPTLFRRARDYQRLITFTAKGVVTVETSGDPTSREPSAHMHAKSPASSTTECRR